MLIPPPHRYPPVLRDERGSLPLVILVAIILGGLIVAIYSQVNSGQITARGDRDFQGAIQVADAGVQAAFTELASLDLNAGGVPAIGGFYPTDATAAGVVADADDPNVLYATSDVGDGEYLWRAKRVQTALWEVRSAGEFRDRTRHVEALVGEQPIFPFALFGNEPLDLQKGGGNNDIDSLTDTIARLGTNGVMALQKQLEDKAPDQLILECYGESAAENCPDDGVTHRMELPFDDVAANAYGPGGECYDADADAAIDDGILDAAWFAENDLVAGEVYCFSQVLFESGGSLGDRQYPLTYPDPPAGEPTRIYINPAGDTRPSKGGKAGGDSVGVDVHGTGDNRSEVNWLNSGAEPEALTSRASDLLIFVPGTRTVKFGNNHSRVAAGIYAPYSTCDLRAQGEIVGSVICGSIEGSGGGWSLTYDETLADYALDDVYSVLHWREETASSTSFEW